MKIRDLHINDFGIIQSQSVTGLGDGVNIIGGPNRAGKTTFMQVLRYLGYKFPRSDILPPPQVAYRVRATLILDDGEEVVLERDGHSDPLIKSLANNRELSPKDIYPLDNFTYRQLFTISLDELNKLPNGVEKKETKQLQSVLLGAGLADAANLTDVLGDFRKSANDIGGVNGNPSVKEFKDANQDINAALDNREKALTQVDEYRGKQSKKKDIDTKLVSLKEQESGLEKQRDRLEYLNQYYSTFSDFRELRDTLDAEENKKLLEEFSEDKMPNAQQLRDSYPEIVQEYDGILRDFRQSIPDENWQAVKSALLDNKNEIREWTRQISGLRERLNSLDGAGKKHEEARQSIIAGMKQINGDWGDDIGVIQKFNTDFVSRARLREEVAEYKEVYGKKETIESEINDLENELTQMEEEIDRLKTLESPSGKRFYWASGLLVILGIMLGILIAPWLGIIVAIGGALALLITLITQSKSNNLQRANQLKSEKRMRESRKRTKEEELDEVVSEWHTLREQISEYRKRLGLDQEIHPDTLREFYEDIAELKGDITEWEQQEETLEESRKRLQEDLRELHSAIRKIFPDVKDLEPNIKDAETLLQKLKIAAEWLDGAQKLSDVEKRKLEQEDKIFALLNSDTAQMSLEDSLSPEETIAELDAFLSQGEAYQELQEKEKNADSLRYSMEKGFTDRIRGAFEYATDETVPESFDKVIEFLETEFTQYLSGEEIAKELGETSEEINRVSGEISELQSELERVRVELEALATTEKLEYAQEAIDKARGRLEPLAREYAINRLAETILEEVQERFMHRTRDELLSKASNYFRRITSGDYEGISLPDNLENADFISLTEKGDAVDTTDYLSRGTQEQLFLSVRLSRIQEIQPPLPVILDDSLVNFDSAHRRQAVDIIEELSKTHQIFVLTCHPEIVEYVHQADTEVQYWTMDNGNIAESDYSGVVKHLA